MTKRMIHGGCLCGAVRYEACGEPYHITHCHCADCRRSSGAAFVTWASFKRRDFAFTQGEPRGDWIAYYSGRDSLEGKTPCQRFTAIGKIAGEDVYQVTLGERFRPFRREVGFCGAREVEIRPLIPKLSFIKDKKHWGLPFRRGYLQVSQSDFRRIAEEMLERQFSPAMRCRPAIKKRN